MGMNDKIESAIQEAVQEAVDKSLQAIRYNLSNELGGLLFSLKYELEKQGGVGDIDNLINHIFNSSRYSGPEDEEYPVWDKKNKKAQEILARLEKVLQAHGIEQSWNIGRGKKG